MQTLLVNKKLLPILTVILIGLALTITGQYMIDRAPLSSRQVAAAYLEAILEGDKELALDYVRGDALCSGPTMYDEIDRHLELFAGSRTRNARITIRDLTGSVAYNPGTDAADITFEYLPPDERAWLTAEFGLVIYNEFICWLWTGE